MLILSVIFYPFLKGDFFLMLGMNSLIGRKFYLSETVKEDFPFPDDIRILDEDENNVIVKKGSKKITIDKIDLHRFYTTIKPDITFAIRYITDIEFLLLKNYYEEKTWNKININENNGSNYTLRNHSIFYRINKENNNSTEIFIVGGYNNSGRNNGLIQVFIDDDEEMEFYIDFKKYEENKVKIKGNNNISLDKYNSMDNIFLFSNEFNQFFDEENNLFYSYNYDNNFNIHVIDNFTLKHTIYRNKLKK